ncbi:peptidoglycan DD-metalloendopeptidase family protein [Streptomyces sp. RY43-2]|uniref:Peptidoglycan DD-metalloendopeptidase family protein n=1 Tax=Streptomyces macrolidinus TaxID=2952607 RepID=A0ABT0ZHS6_9ACTN|nr:M23 family metallopeptidase [Streptomyces macrolidinus]MCN9243105.1 peptidoglycan DD-metalloendopeptidase family protein [Streptomyces macrolidinus]
MRSPRRSPLHVPVFLCAVALLLARPAAADGGSGGGEADSGVSARVVRLYEDAAAATQRYEAVHREAEKQLARARRSQRLLAREQKRIAGLHDDLGRIARAQYRQVGGVPYAAQIILADSPEELMRSQHVFSQANLAVETMAAKSRRAESRLAEDQARSSALWRDLEKRNRKLAGMKKAIQAKLDEARRVLQKQADASAAAGTCRSAVHLDEASPKTGRPWVAPVRDYRLSAPFGSGGTHWANRHTGQDFAVPIGTPVRAVGAGKVVKVTCGGAFGMEVVIEHPGGYCTQYAHLAAVTVNQGDRVATGQWIAQSGTTGNSTGPHLHFEVRVTPQLGSGIDPVPWLTARGVKL